MSLNKNNQLGASYNVAESNNNDASDDEMTRYQAILISTIKELSKASGLVYKPEMIDPFLDWRIKDKPEPGDIPLKRMNIIQGSTAGMVILYEMFLEGKNPNDPGFNNELTERLRYRIPGYKGRIKVVKPTWLDRWVSNFSKWVGPKLGPEAKDVVDEVDSIWDNIKDFLKNILGLGEDILEWIFEHLLEVIIIITVLTFALKKEFKN